MIDLSRNHFELFGLPVTYAVDAAALERAYRELQGEVHPDRFADGDEAQRRLAMQRSARVNEAFRALKDPVERARYLLELHGVDAFAETDTRLPLAFLETQLERREAAAAAAAAADVKALETLVDDVRAEFRTRQQGFAPLLDAGRLDEAKALVRELRFLDKVADDVEAMLAALDA